MSSPIYTPTNKCPKLSDCTDTVEFEMFIKAIFEDTTLSSSDKRFLQILATRFIKFKYEKLADLYANTNNNNIKSWLEKLRCVIIDDNSAIMNGYFTYVEEYQKFVGGIVGEKSK